MAPVIPARRWALLALTLSGCGQPLVDDQYQGQPKLHLQGKVDGQSTQIDLANPFARTGVFWAPGDPSAITGLGNLVEQPANGAVERVPSPLDWSLYEDPEPFDLVTTASGVRYGLGLLYMYLDKDGNGRHDAADPLIGDAPANLVLYAEKDLSEVESPTGVAVPKGYHLISGPISCGVAPTHGDGDCGVPLGASCAKDADCGQGGLCLQGQGWPWPGGACAIAEPPPRGCRPRGGVLFSHPVDQGPDAGPPLNESWWVQACSFDSDCTRGPPYQCDYGHGACLPTTAVGFSVQNQVMVRPPCGPR